MMPTVVTSTRLSAHSFVGGAAPLRPVARGSVRRASLNKIAPRAEVGKYLADAVSQIFHPQQESDVKWTGTDTPFTGERGGAAGGSPPPRLRLHAVQCCRPTRSRAYSCRARDPAKLASQLERTPPPHTSSPTHTSRPHTPTPALPPAAHLGDIQHHERLRAVHEVVKATAKELEQVLASVDEPEETTFK